MEAQDCGLLAPVLGRGARKDTSDFADELALCPEAACCIKELPHLAGHVPKTGRCSENNGVGFTQVVDAGNRNIGKGHLCLCRPHGFDYGGGQGFGDALDNDINTGNFVGAVGDCLCKAVDMAVGRVEKH